MQLLRRIGGKRPHPAWKILIACCFIQFGGMGVLSNSIGVFFPAVCADLGFTTTQISFHITIRGLATMVVLPLAGRLISRYPSKYVLTPAAAMLVCSIASMAFFSKLWQWYVASVFYGLAGAFLFLNMSPVLLTNWFKARTGFAVGIAMACSGLGGIVMNPVGNALIESMGWRATYLIFAGIGAVCMLPFTAFALERCPQDAGVSPYTGTDARLVCPDEKKSGSDRHALSGLMKSPVFWMFFAAVIIVSFETVFIYHFPGYALSVGLSAAIGSTMSSASMAGNLLGKFYLGWLNDKLDSKRSFLWGILLTMSGMAIIQFFHHSPSILAAGSLLYGACMALTAVSVPLLILELFDRSQYAAALSMASMITSAMGGIGTSLIGILYDASGSYTMAFMLAQILCAVCAVLLFAAFRLKNMKIEWKDSV